MGSSVGLLTPTALSCDHTAGWLDVQHQAVVTGKRPGAVEIRGEHHADLLVGGKSLRPVAVGDEEQRVAAAGESHHRDVVRALAMTPPRPTL